MSDPKFINPMEWQQFLSGDSESEDWSFELKKEDIKRLCKHEWVNQSFMFEKLCCKHCDIEKTVWEKYLAKEKVKSNTYFS